MGRIISKYPVRQPETVQPEFVLDRKMHPILPGVTQGHADIWKELIRQRIQTKDFVPMWESTVFAKDSVDEDDVDYLDQPMAVPSDWIK